MSNLVKFLKIMSVGKKLTLITRAGKTVKEEKKVIRVHKDCVVFEAKGEESYLPIPYDTQIEIEGKHIIIKEGNKILLEYLS